MTPTTAITSKDNPQFKAAMKLKENRHRKREGLMLLEGEREVQRAFDAGLVFVSVWQCASRFPELVSRITERHDVRDYELSDNLFEKLAYRENPEGLLAIVRMPALRTIDALTLLPGHDLKKTLFLVTVEIEKPGNLGAMVRSAAAAGATALINIDANVDIFNPNCIRSSTCQVFDFPVYQCSLAAWRQCCQQHEIACFPAMLDSASVSLHEISIDTIQSSAAIIIGPEDRGLDRDWLDIAIQTQGQPVYIPMVSDGNSCVDSLNASNAAAICLFEFRRQLLASEVT